MKQTELPDALLLISTQCPHCHVLQDLLQQRFQGEDAAHLQTINIDDQPDTARALGIRSVPWLKLGLFEFDGVLTPDELDRWISQAMKVDSNAGYLEYLLANGKLVKAIAWLKKYKVGLDSLLTLVVKDDVKMNVRIGIGAVMEDFEGSTELVDSIPKLIQLAQHVDPTVRADACHYLMLSHSDRALSTIESMLNDVDEQVQTIARESLEDL